MKAHEKCKYNVIIISGLGLFGLSVLRGRRGLVRSFTFTDCHPKVLNFLQINATINCGDGKSRKEDEIYDFKRKMKNWHEQNVSQITLCS
jgi:hypothetical protein